MKFVDCVWELKNIGKRTCEITYNETDAFERHVFEQKVQDYEYIVVKVPMNRLDINYGLGDMGFIMIETQINISKNYKDFNFDDRLVKRLLYRATERVITEISELNDIFDKMTINMFSTDRIYLDPHFPRDYSCRRYSNWMRTENPCFTSFRLTISPTRYRCSTFVVPSVAF